MTEATGGVVKERIGNPFFLIESRAEEFRAESGSLGAGLIRKKLR